MKNIDEKEAYREMEFNKLIEKLKPAFGYPANAQFIKDLDKEMEELFIELSNNNADIIEEIISLCVSMVVQPIMPTSLIYFEYFSNRNNN